MATQMNDMINSRTDIPKWNDNREDDTLTKRSRQKKGRGQLSANLIPSFHVGAKKCRKKTRNVVQIASSGTKRMQEKQQRDQRPTFN